MTPVNGTSTRSIRTRVFRDDQTVAHDFPPAAISDYIADPQNVAWLDITSPERADFDVIGEELGLHSLAVEDALHDHQRPKIDRYESHLFLTIYFLIPNGQTGELDPTEVNAFITRNALVTVHQESINLDAIESRWQSMFPIVSAQIGVLVHGLVDYAVDDYFAIVQELDDEIDRVEEILFDGHSTSLDVQQRSFHARKNLVVLRRAALPMREVVNTLMRRDLNFVGDTLTPYYQDIYDHILRVTEWTESLRDLVATVLDTHLSIQSNYLNEVMRKLTAWAAIIAVPTAITGFYGQNVPYPGFGQFWGFVTSTTAIIVISGMLWIMFRAQKWL